jgi:hypothetical protein
MDQEELDYLLDAVSALSSKPEKDPMQVLDLSPMSTLPAPVRLILKGWIRGLTSSEKAAELLLQFDMDKEQIQTLLALTAWAQQGPCGCLGTA